MKPSLYLLLLFLVSAFCSVRPQDTVINNQSKGSNYKRPLVYPRCYHDSAPNKNAADEQDKAYQHMVITNQSESLISIFYKRIDPGFLGHSVINENITVADNETIEIQALRTRSKRSPKKYTLIKCVIDQKSSILKLNNETIIKILKDKTIEASSE